MLFFVASRKYGGYNPRAPMEALRDLFVGSQVSLRPYCTPSTVNKTKINKIGNWDSYLPNTVRYGD